MIEESKWTEADTQRALQIWAEYQKQNDVSMFEGKTAAIDPMSGRVWIGEDAREVSRLANADGVYSRIFGLRIGQTYYLRKGGSAR